MPNGDDSRRGAPAGPGPLGFLGDAERARNLVEGVRDFLVAMRAIRDRSGQVVDWRYVDANSGTLTLMRMTRDEFLARTVREVLSPERFAARHPLMLRALAGERTQYEGEAGGRVLLVTLFALDAETVCGASMDLTAQREAERRNEELARFPEENPDPVLRVAGGRIAYANPAALASLAALGLATGDRPPPQLERLAQEASSAGRAGGELAAAGRVFSVRAVRVGGGVNVYAQDVTARARAEARRAILAEIADDLARLSSEEDILVAIGARLAAHLDVSSCSVADLADGHAKVRLAYERSGVPRPITRMRVADFLDEELRRTAEAGRTVVLRDLRTDPRVSWARYEALGVRAGVIVPFLREGEWRHSFAVGTTGPRDWRADEVELLEEVASRFFPRIDRARAEEAIRAANARKSEFIGVLSHELRNALAPLRTGVAVLERIGAGNTAAVRARAVLDRQVAHLTHLVDDLLEVRRMETGEVRLRRAVIDAAEVVARTCAGLQAAFAEAGPTLTCHAREPVLVDADETRLQQIVANVLDNARKFTPRGGRVTAEVGVEGGRCRIQVTDEGAGFLPEDGVRIFEPFFQTEDVRRASAGGLGIGLAIARRLAEAHAGRLDASSPGPGKGSTFTLELPLHAGTAQPTGAPEVTAQPARRLSVVLVEDGVDAGEMLRELLVLEGHEVSLYGTGREALQALQLSSPDVLICDIGLPDMSGYDVVAALRGREGGAARVFAVALTGMARPEDVQRASAAGFDAHLAKPATWEGLAAVLSRAAAHGPVAG